MIPPGATLLVADLHLAPDTPVLTGYFLRFLEGPARQAARLIILGDLFDAWAGDDDLADPFNTRIVSALRTLTERGVAVDFLAGNRDFLIGADFAQAAQVRLLPDPCVLDLAGVACLLTHGDTLCADDVAYQDWRAETRTPAWQTAFLGQPLAERKQIIATLRARSETEKRGKSQAIMDVNEAAVVAALAAHQVRTLIHGHTHRQGCHAHRMAGDSAPATRWVLGDWRNDRISALVCAGPDWRWLALADL